MYIYIYIYICLVLPLIFCFWCSFAVVGGCWMLLDGSRMPCRWGKCGSSSRVGMDKCLFFSPVMPRGLGASYGSSWELLIAA